MGKLRGFQGRFLRAAGFVVEGGVRVDEVAEALRGVDVLAGEDGVGFGERGEQFGELAGEVAEHAGILRALAGEERGEFAARGGGAEGGAVGEGPTWLGCFVVESREGCVARGGEGRVFQQRNEQAELRFAAECLARGVGAAAEVGPREFSGEGGELGAEVGARVGGEGEDFHVAIPADFGAGRAVFFEHAVEVRATEAERAHAGAARVRGAREPRAFRRVDVEGRAGRGFVQGLRDLDGGREDFVFERERGLDEAGHSGGGLRVADLRLHGTERGPGAVGFRGAEDFGERTQFGGVAYLCAGAVGFDEVNGLRRRIGGGVGPAQGVLLAFGARFVNRAATAVAGGADAFDDAVNLVAVALGIGEAFQHEHAEAFAEDGAVAVFVEGLRISRRRERRGFAEAHIHEDVVERVHAAGDDHVRAAGLQLQRGEVQRGHRTGARGVHHAVGPAEVEARGDAASSDVPEQAGKGILLPRHVAVGDALHHVFSDFAFDAGFLERAPPDGMAEPCAERDDEFQRAGDAEDDAGALLVEGLVRVARVGERLLRGDHAKQLRRVRGFDVLRGDAVFERVKIQRGQEAATLGVSEVGSLGVLIEKVRGLPVRGGDGRDGVHAGLDVGPVSAEVVRLREDATDANDGEGGGLTHYVQAGFAFNNSCRRFNSRGAPTASPGSRGIPCIRSACARRCVAAP